MIDISPADEMIVNAILKKHVAKCEVRAFGSRHKWMAKSYSNLDLVIVGAAKLDKSVIYALQEAFEESELSFRVDVLDWHAISDEFRAIIEQGYSVIQEKQIDNQLPAGWTVKKLGDVCHIQTGPFGSQLKNEQYIYDGTPVITVEHIKTFQISEFNYPSVSDCDKNRLSKYILNEGDIIFSRVGSVDLNAVVKKKNVGWLFSSRMLRARPDKELVEPLFLAYYLRTPSMREHIKSIAVGATMPSINTEILKNILIKYPSIEKQKEISAILSSLDDKIELNQQINKKLEEMAQAIFKEWFIDFNFPDENGNPYRDSGGSMIDSELGQIPAPWSVGCFNDLISETVGGDWGKEISQGNYNQEVLCIRGADIKELKTGNKSNAPKRYILEKNLKNKQLSSNDIVIEISGGSPTQSTGRTLFITNELLNQFKIPLICTNFCRRLRFNANHNSLFCYLYLNYLYDNDIFFNYENGTTGVKNLDTTNLFSKHQIILPSDNILQLFYEQIVSVINGIYFYGKQSQKISNIRDTLLPKLVSGHFSNYK